MRDDLNHALGVEATRLGDQLNDDIEHLRRLDAWLALDIPGDLRAHLEAESADLAGSVVDRLLAWQRTGGRLVLAPGGGEETVPEDEPFEIELEPESETPEEEEVGVEAQEDDSDEDTSDDDTDPTVSQHPPPEEDVPTARIRREPPASAHALQALVARIERGEAQITPTGPVGGWPRELDVLLSDVALHHEPETEGERVSALVARTSSWTRFPQSVQRQLLGLCAARLRRLQDEVGIHDWKIRAAFSTLTSFSGTHRPGFVNGLSRSQSPLGASWEADAESWWDELDLLRQDEPDNSASRERLLAEITRVSDELPKAPPFARAAVESQLVTAFRNALAGGVRGRDPGLVRLASRHEALLEGRDFKALRRAVRDAGEDEKEAAEPSSSGPPDDWAWWPWTRGRRGVLVGGSPREERRAALERAFQFGTLSWEDAMHRPNMLQTLSKRIEAGTYDLVLILGEFIGHDTDDTVLAACKASGVAWAHVDRGYGASRIQHVIERYLDPVGRAGDRPD